MQQPTMGQRKDQPKVDIAVFIESVVDYAIISLDPTGRVSSWNAGASRLKGYSADEIIG